VELRASTLPDVASRSSAKKRARHWRSIATLIVVAFTSFPGTASSLANHNPKSWCGPRLSVFEPNIKNESSVTVTGTLKRKLAWGPPNFGENPRTDSRWRAWVLDLDYVTPVAFVNSARPPVITERISIRRVQVRGTRESNGGFEEFLNRHVAVEGKLWQPVFPTDIEDVILDAAEIRFTRDVDCRGIEKLQKV
jgi:hypothetical protein